MRRWRDAARSPVVQNEVRPVSAQIRTARARERFARSAWRKNQDIGAIIVRQGNLASSVGTHADKISNHEDPLARGERRAGLRPA